VDGSSQTLPPPSNIVWMKKLTGTRVVESTLPTAVPHSASMTTVAAPAKGRTTVKLSNQGLRTANHPQNMPSYDHYGNKINQGSIDPVATSLDSQPSKQAASHASSVPSASPPSAATGNGQASTESDPKPVVLTRGGQQIFNVPKSRPAFDYRGQKIAYDQAGSNGDKTEFEQVHRNLTQLGQEQQKSPSLAQRNQAQQSPSFNRLAATLDAGETESASFAFQDASALSVTSPTVRTAQKMTQSLTPLTGSTHGIISEKNSLTSVDAPAKTGPGSQPSEPAASRATAVPLQSPPSDATDNDQAKVSGDPRPVVLTRGGQRIPNEPKGFPQHINWFMDKRFDKKGR